MRSELNIIRRDWSEYKAFVLILTAGMFIPFLGRGSGFSKGFLTGLLISAAYGYAQFTFFIERQRRTLDLLLSLPIRPMNVILAKYASAYSMTLFTVNGAGILLGDLQALFITNATAVFMATFCMTPSVLSDKPWAPNFPLYFVFLAILPFQKILARYWPAGLEIYRSAHFDPTIVALVALIISPVIALIAALLFERKAIQ